MLAVNVIANAVLGTMAKSRGTAKSRYELYSSEQGTNPDLVVRVISSGGRRSASNPTAVTVSSGGAFPVLLLGKVTASSLSLLSAKKKTYTSTR